MKSSANTEEKGIERKGLQYGFQLRKCLSTWTGANAEHSWHSLLFKSFLRSPNSTRAGLICSPGDPTGRARTALSQLPFSQCFYREHLQALPFVQHILKEKEEQKKEKSVKVQYVFLLLSSLTNSSHLSLPHFMRLCSCTGPSLVCPNLNGTNLPDSLVNHIGYS